MLNYTSGVKYINFLVHYLHIFSEAFISGRLIYYNFQVLDQMQHSMFDWPLLYSFFGSSLFLVIRLTGIVMVAVNKRVTAPHLHCVWFMSLTYLLLWSYLQTELAEVANSQNKCYYICRFTRFSGFQNMHVSDLQLSWWQPCGTHTLETMTYLEWEAVTL